MKSNVELQSLVDSHERPFLVFDDKLRIVALNRAYEIAYRVDAASLIGRHCYEVSHARPRPCFEMGEECPYQEALRSRAPYSCLHIHKDGHGRDHWVRVNVYPLKAADGTLYFGENIREISSQDASPLTDGIPRMVGESPAFLTMVEQLELAAGSDLPVLLQGETGTGKELAARFVHRHSGRRDGPFQTVDCTVLNEALAENELFGHERGAFTGSSGKKRGLFELADGGTLFLDEIGDLPPPLQAKLLRVLENGEFRRVGGEALMRVDVRVVCASNRNLWDAVKAGRFREDLYYRIACMSVQLPSLRDRIADLTVLAVSLLESLQQASGRRHRLRDDALQPLERHGFPGNIRELRNILSAAAALAHEGRIHAEHIRRSIRQPPGGRVEAPGIHPDRDREERPLPVETQTTIGQLEARHIEAVLRAAGGHKGRAAQALGISTRTLYRKLKRYGLG